MATILGLLKKVEAFDPAALAIESIEETKDVIADLNAEQLYTGKRSDGSDITPQYSPITIEIKKEKGQPTDRVTLRDTGEFYQGLRVDVQGEEVRVYSTDEKSEDLFKRYATPKKNIFGLNSEYKAEYIKQVLRKRYMSKVRKVTGL